MRIRVERLADEPEIRQVNDLAFGQPAEAVLVDRLRTEGLVVVSLVAVAEEQVVGHILFSRLPIDSTEVTLDAVALAPMAVLPEYQRTGIGSALVQEGLRLCSEAGVSIVIVVGHPDFYSRFGFSAALARRLRSPYAGDAFMALELKPGVLNGVTGEVRYPPAFADV